MSDVWRRTDEVDQLRRELPTGKADFSSSNVCCSNSMQAGGDRDVPPTLRKLRLTISRSVGMEASVMRVHMLKDKYVRRANGCDPASAREVAEL